MKRVGLPYLPDEIRNRGTQLLPPAMTPPKIYPYVEGDQILELVPLAQYQADVDELNARLTQQHADMLDTVVGLRRDNTRLREAVNYVLIHHNLDPEGCIEYLRSFHTLEFKQATLKNS